MAEQDDLFFIVRSGDVWACWLSGKPAVNLGSEAEVRAAMAQFSVLAGAPGKAHAPPPPKPAAAVPQAHPPQPASSGATSAAQSAENERSEARHELTVSGRIFARGGRSDVVILDLSERGCRFQYPSGKLNAGEAITIKLGTVGPVAATVKWHRGQYTGVQFNSPLYPSVMDHIREQFDMRR